MRLLTTIILLLAAAPLRADPEDFARGVPIRPAAEGAAQRFPLPADVYRWVTRPDLGDLTLYDADGNVVPYALRRPRSDPRHTPWQPLPLFPLPEPRPAAAGGGVDIELGEGGTVVAVRGPAATRPGEVGYLLDVSDFPRAPTALRLSWPASANDFVARLRVEASDDLSRWRSLVSEATVAALHARGEAIRIDTIEIPASRAAYLRLLQLGDGPPVAFDAAEARSRSALEESREWLTLPGSPRSGPAEAGAGTGRGFEFQLPGHFPVDRVGAVMEADTFLLEARLLARRTPDERWQDLGTQRFYRARVDGQLVESQPARGTELNYRYWRLEPSDEPESPPSLRVGWQPDEMIFVRQGATPYLLAYGRAGFQGRQWPVAELLDRLDSGSADSGADPAQRDRDAELLALPAAAVGDPQELGGPSRVEARPQPVAWRTVTLWLVLLAGVGLVALLAYRLVRSGPAN